MNLWEFPEALLFHIVSFVEGPTRRAFVVCHQLAPVAKAFHSIISCESSELWDAILTSDYSIARLTMRRRRQGRRGGGAAAAAASLSSSRGGGATGTIQDEGMMMIIPQRSSERLRQSRFQRVRAAHLMIRDNTEICYHHLTEMCATPVKTKCLSRGNLIALLGEYGPHLRINHRVSSGGAFLVECCRARHVREKAVLKCVEELVEHRGASDVNLSVHENPNHDDTGLTSLCVAASRGMSSIVRYLLRKGANPTLVCTGRFRLHSNPRKSVKCTHATALQFATKIHSVELMEGATAEELSDLSKCIRLLQNASS